MAIIDHLILNVNELDSNVDFYVNVMGFALEKNEDDGPYTTIRVNEGFILSLAPYGSKQWDHLAFSLSREEFQQIFDRVKDRGIPYGSSWNNVGTNTGPGTEHGARGLASTIYFEDQNRHLIEIRLYE
jgi:catechol 2,3-dioxygenase-like lactoylglutathione lyase family enzyme